MIHINTFKQQCSNPYHQLVSLSFFSAISSILLSSSGEIKNFQLVNIEKMRDERLTDKARLKFQFKTFIRVDQFVF